MIAVLVGTASRISSSTFVNPSTAVFLLLVVVYITAAVLHPREFFCLVPSLLYFLALPSIFILLQIYALFNLNNVSWGTREIKTSEEATVSDKVIGSFKKLADETDKSRTTTDEIVKIPFKWTDHPQLAQSAIQRLSDLEEKFFGDLIKTYLDPIAHDKEHKTRITADLKSLRNNYSFVFCMINAIWLALIFNLQYIQSRVSMLIEIPIGEGDSLRYEPLSFIFVIIFILVTLLQYFAMLWHRYKTMLHMIYTASMPKRRKTDAAKSTPSTSGTATSRTSNTDIS